MYKEEEVVVTPTVPLTAPPTNIIPITSVSRPPPKFTKHAAAVSTRHRSSKAGLPTDQEAVNLWNTDSEDEKEPEVVVAPPPPEPEPIPLVLPDKPSAIPTFAVNDRSSVEIVVVENQFEMSMATNSFSETSFSASA